MYTNLFFLILYSFYFSPLFLFVHSFYRRKIKFILLKSSSFDNNEKRVDVKGRDYITLVLGILVVFGSEEKTSEKFLNCRCICIVFLFFFIIGFSFFFHINNVWNLDTPHLTSVHNSKKEHLFRHTVFSLFLFSKIGMVYANKCH